MHVQDQETNEQKELRLAAQARRDWREHWEREAQEEQRQLRLQEREALQGRFVSKYIDGALFLIEVVACAIATVLFDAEASTRWQVFLIGFAWICLLNILWLAHLYRRQQGQP